MKSKFLILLNFIIILQSCKKSESIISFPYSAANKTVSDNRPNVIFLLGDDIGWEVPGYTGGQSYSTPNIDELAAENMQFNRCHGAAMCSPSRFMILTGKYNNRNYGVDSWGNLSASEYSLADLFKNAGYSTCAVGKWQLNGGDRSLKELGFQKYRVTNPYKIDEESSELNPYKNPVIYQDGEYLSSKQTEGKYGEDMFKEYAFKFIDSVSKPFFIYWATNLCHYPFVPTPDDPRVCNLA